MASKVTSRDTVNLILAGIMAVSLAVAVVGGIVGVVRFGLPDGTMATSVAETAAWLFGAALMTSFVLAAANEIAERGGGH